MRCQVCPQEVPLSQQEEGGSVWLSVRGVAGSPAPRQLQDLSMWGLYRPNDGDGAAWNIQQTTPGTIGLLYIIVDKIDLTRCHPSPSI